MPEWAVQIIAADQLYISKKDRVNDTRLSAVLDILKMLNGSALKARENLTSITINQLFLSPIITEKIASYDFFNDLEFQQHQDIKTFIITRNQPINWVAFGVWLNLLLKKHGENVLRVKGILEIEESDEPLLIQGVQHCIYPPEYLDTWSWEAESKIVFIVRGLDINIIQKSFKIFMRLS